MARHQVGLDIAYKTVYQLVRYQLKAKLKVQDSKQTINQSTLKKNFPRAQILGRNLAKLLTYAKTKLGWDSKQLRTFNYCNRR